MKPLQAIKETIKIIYIVATKILVKSVGVIGIVQDTVKHI